MRTANNKEGGKITEASALVYLLLATALFVDFGWGYKVNISVLFQLLNIKQLLDVVFKIFRIIKVEVGVISRSRRKRLITLNKTLIILDITKIPHQWATTTKNNGNAAFASLTRASNTKSANLSWLPSEIMYRGVTWHDYLWSWVQSLTWLLYNLQLDHRHRFRKFTVLSRPIRKKR